MSAPRRALRIAHVNPEMDFSGGEAQMFLLMEGLRKRGHEPLLICRHGSRCQAEAEGLGVATTTTPMWGDGALQAVPVLARRFRAAGAHLVHLHTNRASWLGGLAARLARLPAVATRRMDRPFRSHWRSTWRPRLVYGRLVRRTVAISPAVAEQLARAGVPAGRLRTIPSAVDPVDLVPVAGRRATRAAEGVDDHAPLLLTVASLVHRKGLDVLLRALAAWHERSPHEKRAPRLWIAGEGPERPALEKQSLELGLGERVRFLGRRGDVADLLAACDVFVLPSRREGLGLAALEAMTAGRPVVATRVGGLADAVVEERTGLLVPPDDPDALAGALARLIEDTGLRRALGAAGPGRVAEGFLAEQMLDAYESLYREVLAERRSP